MLQLYYKMDKSWCWNIKSCSVGQCLVWDMRYRVIQKPSYTAYQSLNNKNVRTWNELLIIQKLSCSGLFCSLNFQWGQSISSCTIVDYWTLGTCCSKILDMNTEQYGYFHTWAAYQKHPQKCCSFSLWNVWWHEFGCGSQFTVQIAIKFILSLHQPMPTLFRTKWNKMFCKFILTLNNLRQNNFETKLLMD